METTTEKYRQIKGWGIDADQQNEPTYPMKNYTGDDHNRLNYERPPQQPANVEILQSIERPGLSAVFGTSTPPSGLSGMIRRVAFRYSEGSWGHWLPLILADRVNVVEGIIDDLRHGHIPNFFQERGWKAEWKYNRKAMVQRMATGVILTTALVTFLMYRRKKK
jgi:hypothetical protein